MFEIISGDGYRHKHHGWYSDKEVAEQQAKLVTDSVGYISVREVKVNMKIGMVVSKYEDKVSDLVWKVKKYIWNLERQKEHRDIFYKYAYNNLAQSAVDKFKENK